MGFNFLFSALAWSGSGVRARVPDAIREAIFRESRKNGLDPILVAAVIEHESGFHPHKRGSHGEIGLMQVKPSTARWVADRRQIAWKGAAGLDDPSFNIEIGTAYLAILRDRFRERRIYLAAYNLGPGRVWARLARRRRVPRRYSRQVLRRFYALGSSV